MSELCVVKNLAQTPHKETGEVFDYITRDGVPIAGSRAELERVFEGDKFEIIPLQDADVTETVSAWV